MNLMIIFGLIAATFTTISFLPQAIKTIRTRKTKDLSLGTYSTLTIGIFLWMIYGIFLLNWPIIIANSISFIFSAMILFIKILDKD